MMHRWRNIIKIFFANLSIFVVMLITPSNLFAVSYSWDNHREPFGQALKVPFYGGVKVAVTLPADFILHRDTITLNFDIESNFFFKIDGLQQKSFEGFIPKVSINGGIVFGNYKIPVKDLPGRQTSKILIKTKYLRAGENELKFIFGKESQIRYKCKSGDKCVGYFIRKMWFEDFLTSAKPEKGGYGSEPPKDPILRLEAGMHTAALWKIDVDAESRYLITGSNDKTVRVWDLSSHRLVRTLRPPIGNGSEGEIHAVAISPDGETIACGGSTGRSWENTYSIYLFDRRRGELIRRLTGLPGFIEHLVFSKDGRFLAAGIWKGIQVYRTLAYTQVGHDNNYGSGCSSADFNPKGQLATASYDGFIRLYDVTEKGIRRIAKQKAPSGTKLFSLKFSPDGSKIAVGYLEDLESQTSVDIFSGRDLKHLYSPNTSDIKRNLEPVAWSADGRSLYAGGYPFSIESKRFAPIFKWSDEGLGSRTVLRAAMFPIQDICPLKNGGIAFISYDTAWGIFDNQDTRVFIQRPIIANYAGHRKGFPISPDATKVLFSYKGKYKYPALFDIEKRSVEVFPASEDNLIWPLAESSGLNITDWRRSKHPKLNGVELKLAKNAISRCLAIAPDGNSFILGTEWNLHCFDRKGKRIWKTRVHSIMHSVNISHDSRIAVAAIGDGTIRWYRIKDGKEILAFFPHSDRKRWIAWTPSGYYMSSPYGDELIGWHINNGKDREAQFYTAMQFERILYRPDYVLTYFRHLGDQKKAAKVLEGNIFDIKNLTSIAPPKIKILSDDERNIFSSPEIQLEITAKKRSLPMQSYTVFVNNIPIISAAERILKGSEQDTFVRKIKIPLFDYENKIRAEVFNGTSMGLAETYIYKSGKARARVKGNLYLLSVGVNDFKNLPDLDYATFDAENFADFFKKEEGNLFNKVFTKVISDHSATKPLKENVLKNLAFLKQAQAQDTVIAFLASHGLSDPAGNYYFVPKDAEAKDLEKLLKIGERGKSIATGNLASLISWESFFDALRSVPGKRLLVVDTCHAKNISGNLDIHSLAKRSATSSFALLAASQGNEQSQEYPEGKQGLFTYALLKALWGSGDHNRDGQVTLTELYNFVFNFVENNRNRSLGKQTPQLVAPIELKDMVLSSS